jgi:hypothetical protein
MTFSNDSIAAMRAIVATVAPRQLVEPTRSNLSAG